MKTEEYTEESSVGSVNLPNNMWDWIRERARREDRSMSSVMRRCVAVAMEDEG